MKCQKHFFCHVNNLTVFEMYLMLTNAHEAKCFSTLFEFFSQFFLIKIVQKNKILKTFVSFCK